MVQELDRRKPRSFPASKFTVIVASSVIALLFHSAINRSNLSSYYNYWGDPAAAEAAAPDTRPGFLNQVQVTRMTKYNTSYHYHPPEAPIPFPTQECGQAPDFGDFFKLNNRVRSRLNEDKIVYEILFKKIIDSSIKGTFVELGAFDGSIESNSMFFERCLGWKGLLIEGNPENFKKVLANRPLSHRMSFAPSCDAEYEMVNKTVQFYRYPMTNVGLVGSAKTYEGKPTVDVPCGPLGPVLQDVFEEEQRIAFFSLDVEGAEPMVLETIDFDSKQIIIEVLMIEVENDNCRRLCETRDKVRAKMAKHGYQRYEKVVQKSDIYIHPQSRFQMPNTTKPNE
jgi:hypothetical protein